MCSPKSRRVHVDMQRTGRIDTDEFHLDFFTLAHVIVTEGFSLFENLVNLTVQPGILRVKLMNPGGATFALSISSVTGSKATSSLANHHRIGPGDSRQLQGKLEA